jgi:hypothetical protein
VGGKILFSEVSGRKIPNGKKQKNQLKSVKKKKGKN